MDEMERAGSVGVALNYNSLAPVSTGLRMGAWISLLTLGILSILTGVCFGGGGVATLVFVFKMAGARGGGPALPPHAGWILVLVGAVYFLIPAGFGTGEVLCALLVRRHSKKGAIAAVVLLVVQLLLVVGLMVMVVIGAASGRARDWMGMVTGLVMLGMVGCVFLAELVVVIKLLRE